jgi:hypothetical protein
VRLFVKVKAEHRVVLLARHKLCGGTDVHEGLFESLFLHLVVGFVLKSMELYDLPHQLLRDQNRVFD